MRYTNAWKDYQCLDSGDKEKLERWGDIVLRRPDPVAIWPKRLSAKEWQDADATYHRSDKGGGNWTFKKKIRESWTIDYKQLTFKVSPTNFKHTGLFPEQAVNWDWMSQVIRQKAKPFRVLNLFAYTGGATMACAQAGADEVVHVDSAKGMVSWAKENLSLCHLENHTVRFMVDDCLKFLQREQRRGRTYHGIIMDPPSYGRGPTGEVWQIEEQLVPLLKAACALMDPEASFLCLNSYTTTFSAGVMDHVMKQVVLGELGRGVVNTEEIGLPDRDGSLILPCGVSGRWCSDENLL